MSFRTQNSTTTELTASSFGSPSGDVAIDNAEGAGSATTASRADHVHPFPAAPAGSTSSSTPGAAGSDGTETTAARSDHAHAREAWGTAASTLAFGDAASAGSAATLARSDHSHGMPAAPAAPPSPATTVTGPDAFGASSVVGTSTEYARADHDHGLPSAPSGSSPSPATTVTGPDAFGAASAVGTSGEYARADHDHGLPAAPASGPDVKAGTPLVGSAPAAPFIIQAGYVSRGDSQSPLAVTFPTAFPHGVLSITLGAANVGNRTSYPVLDVVTTPPTVDGFTVNGYESGAVGYLDGFNWMAIGW